jgi:hypothetical protein
MLISFSVAEMLPYIRAGIRQASGEHVIERVKRQTIRTRGARAEKLLAHAGEANWTIPYDLHLYWCSRSPKGKFLGLVEHVRVYPIEMLHSSVQPADGRPEYQCLKIELPRAFPDSNWQFWSPQDGGLRDGRLAPDANGFARFAYKDGFDSVEAFRDFFVPNRGDHFKGIVFTW